VKSCLDALCEGAGVVEVEGGDVEVYLDAQPTRVRCHEQPRAVTLFCTMGDDLSYTTAVAAALNTYNRCTRVFRAFFEDGCVVLRADLSASPLSTYQIQSVLESFEDQVGALERAISEAL